MHAGMLGEGFETFTPDHSKRVETGMLDPSWCSGDGISRVYCFYYRHPRSSLTFEMRGVIFSHKVVMLMDTSDSDAPVLQATVATTESASPDALSALVKKHFAEASVPNTSAPSVQPRPQPQPPIDIPFHTPPVTGTPASGNVHPSNLLHDYGRSDLAPSGTMPVGGNLVGPEIFQGQGRQPTGEMFGPDGVPVCARRRTFFCTPASITTQIRPPPPGARYDPINPGDPTLGFTPGSRLGPGRGHPDLDLEIHDPLLAGKGKGKGLMGDPFGFGGGGRGGFGGGGFGGGGGGGGFGGGFGGAHHFS